MEKRIEKRKRNRQAAFQVRMTFSERDVLKKFAESRGTNMGELLRKLLWDHYKAITGRDLSDDAKDLDVLMDRK